MSRTTTWKVDIKPQNYCHYKLERQALPKVTRSAKTQQSVTHAQEKAQSGQ